RWVAPERGGSLQPVAAVEGRDRVELNRLEPPDLGLDVLEPRAAEARREPLVSHDVPSQRRDLHGALRAAPRGRQRGRRARYSSRSERVTTPAGRPSIATSTAFVPLVKAFTISSTEADASIVARGGCIAVATSSCNASPFLNTRSSR